MPSIFYSQWQILPKWVGLLADGASTFEEKESMRVSWKAQSVIRKNTLSDAEIRQALRVQKEWEWINHRLAQHFGNPEAPDPTRKKNKQ